MYLLRRKKNSNQQHSSVSRDELLTKNIEKNLQRLKDIFQDCSDVVFREFYLAQNEQIKLALVYTEGMADREMINEQIIHPLVLEIPEAASSRSVTRANALSYIKMKGISIQKVKEVQKVNDVVQAVLAGNTVLLVDGHGTALDSNTKGWKQRSIEESGTELVVRGPRESFVETMQVNTSMLRRKIKTPDLKFETFKLGEQTQTDVALGYIKGIASDGLVEEARKRLSRINIDGILESGYIEELIRDNPYSIFPTVAHTERPDRVAAYLLEGRVAIIVDGTPVVLTAPSFFLEAIHTPEDYYESSMFMTAIRMLRVLALVIALILPSLYVAIVSFHQEMLPTPLLLSIAAQREVVPLPVFIEALLMEVAFEIIREAGIRLPRPVGQAISIVAALIVGEAAVSAGLVAGATIIVVALTAMASFTVYYSGSLAFRGLRFPLIFLSASLGLFGLIAGIIIIIVHMASLRSFGVPYLAPVAPIIPGDIKDSAVRVPWWAMYWRPAYLGKNNLWREKPGQKPEPPDKK